MRLALVTETFPPEVNGVAMTLSRLVDGVVERSWSVQVVRPLQKGEDEFDDLASREFEELIVPGLPLPGYDGLRMGEPPLLSLFSNWRKTKPDIVHIATEGPLGLAAIAVAKFLHIPLSSTFHTNFHQYATHYSAFDIRELFLVYLRLVHNACDCTLAPTRQLADELSSQGIKRMGVLSRGVDTKLFRPDRRCEDLRRCWGVGPNDKVLLYVGRVAKEKNIQLAIDAYIRIRETVPNVKMVVVGDGPEREQLEKTYPELCYAGMRRGEDLARHYASGDFFIFPSVTETFGNVVTEGLSSGLAVVSFDYAAGREYIKSGFNGYLAEFDRDEAFLACCLDAVTAAPEITASIRGKARETAIGVSWDRIIDVFVEKLENVYESSKSS